MKKIFLLIALFYSLSFCQSWNATVTTSINEGAFTQMDLFTNKDGNHLLIKKTTGDIVYYNVKSSGVVDSSKTETLESGADFPNIVGSNNKIYALYKVGDLIKGKYSTDGGTTWLALSNNITMNSSDCNGVDAVYELNNGVHIVWATKYNSSNYETYYYRLNDNYQWVDYKQVTDYFGQVGGFPSVTYSSGRVHVGYNSGNQAVPGNTGKAKSRDKSGANWETPQTILDSNSIMEKLHAGTSKLFDFYYKYVGGTLNLYVKTRALDGSTWSSDTLLQSGTDVTDLLSVANSADGKTHIVVLGANNTTIHKVYSDSGWSSDEVIANTGAFPRISATTNDLFVMWRKQSYNPRYLQYDTAPAIPQNYQISTPMNQSPVLSWDANSEPDIHKYRVYKVYSDSDGVVLYSGSVLIDSTTYSYTDTTFTTNYKTGVDVAEYWVEAEDISSYISDTTSHLTGLGTSWYQQKVVRHDGTEKTVIEEYGLSQNYPNPFNPSTEISYQIPAKGFVTLKVYDILGNEVSTLVNEWQEQGSYSAQFTTSGKQLASGMYFYTLTAGKFTDTKKFILLK